MVGPVSSLGSIAEFMAETQRLSQHDEAFWQALDQETDRGLMVAAGAYFEAVLGRCLVNYFSKAKSSEDLVKPRAALGTYSAKADCCLALRIIDDFDHRRLKTLGKIRNHLAHEPLSDFGSAKPKAWIKEFNDIGTLPYASVDASLLESQSQKHKFTAMIMFLSLDLQRREFEILWHINTYPSLIPTYIKDWDRQRRGSQS